MPEAQQTESTPKDVWDKFAIVSTFASTVLIAGVSLGVGAIYKAVQDSRAMNLRIDEVKVQQVELVQKFMPDLVSENPRRQQVAFAAISALGNPELATSLRAQLQGTGPIAFGLAAADAVVPGGECDYRFEEPKPPRVYSSQINDGLVWYSAPAGCSRFDPAVRQVQVESNGSESSRVFLDNYAEGRAESRNGREFFSVVFHMPPNSSGRQRYVEFYWAGLPEEPSDPSGSRRLRVAQQP